MLDWTGNLFESFDIPSFRLDAELLLSHVLNCSRIQLYLDADKPVNARERDIFRGYVKQRSQRIPVAYILGIKEFWSIDFKVNRHVLIPRPDTEKLVEIVIDQLKGNENPRILDIGTGSGCIAVALGRELPGAEIIAMDISDEALAIAKENVKQAGLEDRISVRRGSWDHQGIEEFKSEGVHAVVSNPPYITSQDLKALPPEISRYEPLLALDGGVTGLDCYPPLVQFAASVLVENGFLTVEMGVGQGADITEIFEKGGLKSVKIYPDDTHRDRIVTGYRHITDAEN